MIDTTRRISFNRDSRPAFFAGFWVPLRPMSCHPGACRPAESLRKLDLRLTSAFRQADAAAGERGGNAGGHWEGERRAFGSADRQEAEGLRFRRVPVEAELV